MTKEELRTELEKMEIKFTTKMNKTQLQELYEAVMVVDATPEGEACEVFGAFEKDSVDCQNCESQTACIAATVRTEEDKKVKKAAKAPSGPRTGKAVAVKSKYKDINELIEDINGVEAGSLCLAFDQLLTVGGGMNEFLETSEKIAVELGVQFRNEKSILGHFKGRAKQGWVIDQDANGIYSVVDVNNGNRVPRSDTKAYKDWKALKDAEAVVEEPVVEPEAEEAVVEEPVVEPEAEEETQLVVNG